MIGPLFFDADKSHMHVILRTISSFITFQKILFLSKGTPLEICDTSPGIKQKISGIKQKFYLISVKASVNTQY